MTVRELSIIEESNKKAHKFQAVSKKGEPRFHQMYQFLDI
jgi:hypothetical protein